jgi:hypothetical protein
MTYRQNQVKFYCSVCIVCICTAVTLLTHASLSTTLNGS